MINEYRQKCREAIGPLFTPMFKANSLTSLVWGVATTVFTTISKAAKDIVDDPDSFIPKDYSILILKGIILGGSLYMMVTGVREMCSALASIPTDGAQNIPKFVKGSLKAITGGAFIYSAAAFSLASKYCLIPSENVNCQKM